LISSAASFDPNQDVAALARGIAGRRSQGFKALQSKPPIGGAISGAGCLPAERSMTDWVSSITPIFFISWAGFAQAISTALRRNALARRATWPMGFAILVGQHPRYYDNLMPANRLGSWTIFSLHRHVSSCRGCGQQWGSQGIYIPEITFFNGMETAGRHRRRVAGFDAPS
jgi:hypothetical protein